MSKNDTCQYCHYNWQPENVKHQDPENGGIVNVLHITCLLDRQFHNAEEKCKHWERIISMREIDRIAEASVKRIEIASDRRLWKTLITYILAVILGAIIAVASPWITTKFKMDSTPQNSPKTSQTSSP